ncbi:hypothetical protein [Stieleria varia]|uniref:hypothetical protein n=1 Tax=Stieleria varia TaxID=2528005 RepID=UPI001E2F2C5F|nr:hypothetical protein [Stieleria varia]
MRKKYLELCRKLWKRSHPESDDPMEADSQSPLEESTTKELHDWTAQSFVLVLFFQSMFSLHASQSK